MLTVFEPGHSVHYLPSHPSLEGKIPTVCILVTTIRLMLEGPEGGQHHSLSHHQDGLGISRAQSVKLDKFLKNAKTKQNSTFGHEDFWPPSVAIPDVEKDRGKGPSDATQVDPDYQTQPLAHQGLQAGQDPGPHLKY